MRHPVLFAILLAQLTPHPRILPVGQIFEPDVRMKIRIDVSFRFVIQILRNAVILISLLTSVLVSGAIGQSDSVLQDSLKSLLTERRVSECDDYIYNARLLIPRYHREGKLDSIDIVIAFCKEHCKTTAFDDYIFLRDVEAGEYPYDWCDSVLAMRMVGLPDGRQIYFDTLWSDFSMHRPMSCFPIFSSSDSEFQKFVETYSASVRDQLDTTSLAFAAIEFKYEDAAVVFQRLANRQFEGTCLQIYYDRKIQSLLEKRRSFATNWSVNIGSWIPEGPIDVLGPKMELGCQAGIRGRRVGADISLLFRFLDPKEPWTAGHKGKLYQTDSFFSIYLGLEPNFTVYSAHGSRLEVFGGIGWDGILGLSADVIDEEYGDYQNSYNVNFGLTQRFFYGNERKWYLGLQARYNMVDFHTDGGTNLSGNTISLNLIWGCMAHGDVQHELRYMGYDF